MIKRLVLDAKKQGSLFVCLPEAFDFMGRPGTNDAVENAELLTDETMQKYCTLAKDEGVWLSLGGFHERIPGEIRIANTHCVVNANGDIVKSYRKIHLFDVDYDGGFQESASTMDGNEIMVIKNTPIGCVGLSTCYDMRFPEQFSILRRLGAEVILVPSAFMPTTGAAHWYTLLRARAIETQCYVVASAQSGVHNATQSGRARESYGHSLIVGPFGEILQDLQIECPSVQSVVIDNEYLQAVRQRMPIPFHRKVNLYKENL